MDTTEVKERVNSMSVLASRPVWKRDTILETQQDHVRARRLGREILLDGVAAKMVRALLFKFDGTETVASIF